MHGSPGGNSIGIEGEEAMGGNCTPHYATVKKEAVNFSSWDSGSYDDQEFGSIYVGRASLVTYVSGSRGEVTARH